MNAKKILYVTGKPVALVRVMACILMACAYNVVAEPHTSNYTAPTKVIVYNRLPTTYELAKTLFPPKTRSVVLDKETQMEQKPVSIAFMINFKYDSTEIKPESRQYLDRLGDMLNFEQLKNKSLKIEGHADASGDPMYNLRLSEARAQAIKQYLVGVCKIKDTRLYTIGYGETKLLDVANPYADVNRRAEFSPWEPITNVY